MTQKEPLFNDGKCILINTTATSVTAECAICGAEYDSIDVAPGHCKSPIPMCGYKEALRKRMPHILKAAAGYSRFYLMQILTGRAEPACQELINKRVDVCESNACGLFVDGVCTDCRCPMVRTPAHEGRNGAAWVKKVCERGYWNNL